MAAVEVRQIGVDIDSLVREDQVHRLVYVDPNIFDLEMERIFPRTWVFIGHESEVRQPGDFKTTSMGRIPVILVRDRRGSLHVLINRCCHRGAVICREETGNAEAFRCPYHGWTYDERGELQAIPGRPYYASDFDLREFGLARASRVESYRGFVFASLSPIGDSLSAHLGLAKDYLDLAIEESPDSEIDVHSGVQRYEFPANWKFQVENWTDHSHAQVVHESAFGIRQRRGQMYPSERGGPERAPEIYGASGSWHGVAHLGRGMNVERTRSGPIGADPGYLERLAAHVGWERAHDLLSADVQLVIFPNFFIQPRRHHFRTLRPIAVDRTEVHAYPYTLKGASDEVNRKLIADVAWWASAAGFGQPDDLECFARCQEGLQAPYPEWMLFLCGIDREELLPNGELRGVGENELTMRGIHREWKRLIRAE
ncbi:MAG: Rieske 2Fe-2S domain-containing protein [Chloroflexi bacterium]|nr:Rieske 2Fe-2S domain-containing protein [Chloroflexota bacterium]